MHIECVANDNHDDYCTRTCVRMLDVIEIGKQTHKALDGKW